MPRIGVAKPDDLSAEEMTAHAKLAEERGFESIWISEDYYFRDAVGPAAALSVATRKMQVGLGVVNIYTRSLPLIAMSAASLDEISNGRTLLGIGTSIAAWMEQQGYTFHKHSLAAIRESIEIIRRLLAGEKVSHVGGAFNIRDVSLTFKAPRAKVPIYVAAMGQRMLQLAGEIGDGVLLSVDTPAEYLKVVRENLALGAEKSGRRASEVDIAGYILFSASDSSEAARSAVKPLLATELAFDVFDPLITGSGLDLALVAPIRKAMEKGDFEAAKAHVTEEIIDIFAIAGTPKECRTRLDRFRRAGLNLPIIYPVGDIRAAIESVR